MRRTISQGLSLVLIAAFFAGCATPAATDDDRATPAADERSDLIDIDTRLEGDPVRLHPTERQTWHFTSERGLTPDAPEEGRVNVAMTATWPVAGIRPIEFLSAPMTQTMLVQPDAMRVTLWIEPSGPVVSNGAFDVAVWGGSTRGMPLLTLTTWDLVRTAEEPFEVQLDHSFEGQHGLLVPAGESLRFLVMVGPPAASETQPLRLVVGGDSPSRVELSSSRYGLDPLEGILLLPAETFEGEVTQAFTPTDCDTAPGVTSQTHELAIPLDAALVDLQLRAKQSVTSLADIDMDLFDGATRVAGGHTPTDDEKIFLAEETLEGLRGKTLDLKVTTCGTGPIPYEVAVQMGTRPIVEAPDA